MKYIITLLILLITTSMHSQSVMFLSNCSNADVKLYEVSNRFQADVLVYKTKHRTVSQLANDGIWYVSTQYNTQNIKICIVDTIFQSDLKVYFVRNRSEAKWITLSKKYLIHE